MLVFNKFDLQGACIERVPLRNTLLEILHPDVTTAIIHVDPDEVQENRPIVEAAPPYDRRVGRGQTVHRVARLSAEET